jgi:hypothetical protein
VTFTFLGKLRPETIAPGSGDVGGGTVVVIDGVGFTTRNQPLYTYVVCLFRHMLRCFLCFLFVLLYVVVFIISTMSASQRKISHYTRRFLACYVCLFWHIFRFFLFLSSLKISFFTLHRYTCLFSTFQVTTTAAAAAAAAATSGGVGAGVGGGSDLVGGVVITAADVDVNSVRDNVYVLYSSNGTVITDADASGGGIVIVAAAAVVSATWITNTTVSCVVSIIQERHYVVVNVFVLCVPLLRLCLQRGKRTPPFHAL